MRRNRSYFFARLYVYLSFASRLSTCGIFLGISFEGRVLRHVHAHTQTRMYTALSRLHMRREDTKMPVLREKARRRRNVGRYQAQAVQMAASCRRLRKDNWFEMRNSSEMRAD